MTIAWGYFAGGESRDLLIEPAGITVPKFTIITSPVKTGTGALQIASGETAGAIVVGGNLTATQHKARISIIECQVNFDGATLSNPIGLIASPTAAAYSADAHALEVGTDRRVRIVRLPASVDWATRIPLTEWSIGVLGNGSYTHLVWVIDCLTLGSNHVWMTVIIDGVTQIARDVGPWVSTHNFAWRVGTFGIDAGVNIRLDDVCGGTSTSVADAPHLIPLAIGLVDAQHPATDAGASNTWARVPGTGEDYYQDWDDATGNDGNTTNLNALVVSTQSSGMESLATLGWAAGAVILENGTGVGPIWSSVSLTGASKGAFSTYCSLAADIVVSKPGGTYEGTLKRLTRTGGGSWARADVDGLFAGAKITTQLDLAWYVTSLMLQWLYSEATLALTPPPTIVQGMMF